MPFNIFPKPSTKTAVTKTLNSSIFPPPATTYKLVCSLLRSLCHPSLQYSHPSKLHLLTPADVQQFLTELYGFEASLHWTWIGCTFPPAEVQQTLSYFTGEHKLSRSQRSALHDFCRKTQADENARKGRLFAEQSGDAGEAYLAGEKKREAQEIVDLERIMEHRLRMTPVGPAYTIDTQGAAIVWYG